MYKTPYIKYIKHLPKTQYFRRGYNIDFEKISKKKNIVLMHSCILK